MKRRQFFAAAGAGIALASGSIIANSQPQPEIKWRLASSYPRARELLFGASQNFAKRLSEITEGKFQIEVFAANEIVPGLQALDAVQDGKVEMCHTSSNYYVNKDPAFCFGTGIPFGPNARQQAAWLSHGGGNQLFNSFCKGYNLRAVACGSTGAKMGGWFRKEVRSVADLNGLKLRIGGLGALVLSRLGVLSRATPGSEIYSALESGALDGADWLSPYDDEKLGLIKVAPIYHYPGWWEGGAQLHFFINLDKWNSLPPHYQAAFEAAAAEAGVQLLARYDAENPAALIRLIKAGTQFRPFSQEVLEACWAAAQSTYTEISASSDAFKIMHDSLVAFRADEYLWWQVAEYSYDTFMIRTRAKG